MPTARPDPDRLESLDPEFARVLRTADPGPALDGPLTFQPPATCAPAAWRQAWADWQTRTLAATVAPVLAAVAGHAARGETREIQALDLGLAAGLDPAAGVRSRAAGGRLLQRLGTARGERWLDKLQRAAASGHTPAHFAVVYAAQSVLFHLPLRLLLPGYAYWEWIAAMTAHPPAGGGPFPEFAAEAAGLRALAELTLSSHATDAAERFRAAANAS